MGEPEREAPSFKEVGHALMVEQTRALDNLIHELAERAAREPSGEDRVLIWMLQAIGVSVHSVVQLTQAIGMSIRDCFGIARSAAETAVNVAYIATGSPERAELAIAHMRQKRWRDLHREGAFVDQKIVVSRDVGLSPDDIPGLAEALVQFSTKSGGEIRDWTSDNVQRRIEKVAEACPQAAKSLAAAIFAIYRPSSELLHGTFYGVNFFWQGSRDAPVSQRQDFDDLWMREHFVTLASVLIFSVSGAIEAVASARNLDRHAERQQRVNAALLAAVETLAADDPDGEHAFALA